MKNKKIMMYIAILILILFIIIIGIIIINNKNIKRNNILMEYIPEEEISDKQFRGTNVVLYFYDMENSKLSTEIRQIDSKILLNNPEKKLIEFLIEGPKADNLIKLIPDGTELINTEIKDGILIINFSKEFIINNKLDENIINESILKTVIQLNEINEIKILINGEEY